MSHRGLPIRPFDLKPGSTQVNNSFAFNYVALILIVLCFSAAVTVGPPLRFPSVWAGSIPGPVKAVTVERELPFGELVYQDLFSSTGETVHARHAETLTTVLLSHDIRANISLYRSPETVDFSQLLNRSISLYRELLGRGVPAEAVHLIVFDRSSPHQAEIRFQREGRA